MYDIFKVKPVCMQMGNSESKVDTIKSNAKEYKIIFVLGGPGSGKGTQVRVFFQVRQNWHILVKRINDFIIFFRRARNSWMSLVLCTCQLVTYYGRT